MLKALERGAKRLVPRSWRKYFRASKYELLMARRAPIDQIVHVGAHFAEDAEFYEACGAETVLWIEADPTTFDKLVKILAERDGTCRQWPKTLSFRPLTASRSSSTGSEGMAGRPQSTA